MPLSIAAAASGAGASDAATPRMSATNTRIDARAVGAQQRGEPAQLAPAAAGAAQAPARVLPQQVQALAEAGVLGRDRRAVVDGRAPVAVRGHRPATSGSSGLRVRKTWSGRPFSTISRYSSRLSSSSSCVPWAIEPPVLEHDDLVGERDRGEPVGDDERRAARHRPRAAPP